MASHGLILKFNTSGSNYKKQIGLFKKYVHHIVPLPHIKMCGKQIGHFLGIFGGFPDFSGISLKFWPKCYTWLEISGNEDSNATIPKFLGGTSKCTEFGDRRGIHMCTIA